MPKKKVKERSDEGMFYDIRPGILAGKILEAKKLMKKTGEVEKKVDKYKEAREMLKRIRENQGC